MTNAPMMTTGEEPEEKPLGKLTLTFPLFAKLFALENVWL